MTRGERALALRRAFDQDTLRVLSYGLYYALGAGRLAPAERALVRPVLVALADAIDEPRANPGEDVHERPAPGRRHPEALAVVPQEVVDLIMAFPPPRHQEDHR